MNNPPLLMELVPPTPAPPVYEELSNGEYALWNATFNANFDLNESLVDSLRWTIADAFTEVERWDLLVERFYLIKIGSEYHVQVYAPEGEWWYDEDQKIYGRCSATSSCGSCYECGNALQQQKKQIHQKWCTVGMIGDIMES